MVLSLSISLLPATGIPAVLFARFGLLLVLMGWVALRWSDRRLPQRTK
jgi:hypothetical protein